MFSSDALSSVAYATEEIPVSCSSASTGMVAMAMPISLAIGALLIAMVSSYRQTVGPTRAVGRAYIASKDNLGVLGPGLIAAAALLTDYVLTVSVSVVAGVFATTSALPALAPYTVELSLGFVVLVTLANLRGVRESRHIVRASPRTRSSCRSSSSWRCGLARCLIGGCPAVGRPGCARP